LFHLGALKRARNLRAGRWVTGHFNWMRNGLRKLRTLGKTLDLEMCYVLLPLLRWRRAHSRSWDFCFCFSGLVILAREPADFSFACLCLWCHFQPRSLCNGINQQTRKRFTLLIKINICVYIVYIHTFNVIKINKTRDYANL
jgi:hypothetical protein